jgi:hypothetical protein
VECRAIVQPLSGVVAIRRLLSQPFYLLRFERVDNLGAYRIPPETGLFIPSVYVNYPVRSFTRPVFVQRIISGFARDSGTIALNRLPSAPFNPSKRLAAGAARFRVSAQARC